MLDEQTLQALPEGIALRLRRLNEEILESLGERIEKIGKLKPSDLHKLKQLRSSGTDVSKFIDRLSSITDKSVAEIYSMFEAASKEDYANYEMLYQSRGLEYIPYDKNIALHRYVMSMAKLTADTYIDMANTAAFMRYDSMGNKVLTSLSRTYQDVTDKAITAVTTGTKDYQSAMRQTIRELADSGIRTAYTPLQDKSSGKVVDYATGYSRRLDTAVRQNILYGLKQCNLGIAELVGKEIGADGWEVSYHSGARPTHVDMGGQQYADGPGVTVNGTYYPPFSDVAHLLNDYNCYHFKTAIILGLSEPTYSKSELSRLKAEDAKTITYEGKTYTRFEATQVQRRLESSARNAKDRQTIAKAAGDDILRRQEQERINQIAQKYHEFSRAAGLPTKMERMSTAGYHRVKSVSEVGNSILTTGINNGNIKLDNKTVRHLYVKRVKDIPNEIDRSKPLEQQARQAFDLRNKYKHNARIAMSDKEMVKLLEEKRPVPSFEHLLEDKMLRKGLSREEALQDIILTSSKTNADVNKEFGL